MVATEVLWVTSIYDMLLKGFSKIFDHICSWENIKTFSIFLCYLETNKNVQKKLFAYQYTEVQLFWFRKKSY